MTIRFMYFWFIYFNGISWFIYYLIHACRRTIKPLAGGNMEVHSFPKGISLNVKVIARLEFELAYYSVTV